jgi:hypothetical protein
MGLRTAQKRHLLRTGMVIAAYLVTFWGTIRYVRHHHPQGAELYVCAALPWFVLCGVIVSMALYLREERDEYSRELAMRTLLWGTGAAMAVNLFVMYLRIFGWKGYTPAPLDICVFAGAVLAARIAYSIADCPSREPKASE